MRTIFIDECKQGPYILTGHLVDDKNIHSLRKTFKERLSKRQHQFHFSKEKDGKRQQMFEFLNLKVVWPFLLFVNERAVRVCAKLH